jgi:hypothetical protein
MSQFQEHAGRLKADLINTDALVVGVQGTDAAKEWTAYTPTVNVGSVGTGSITGRYAIVGKICHYSILLRTIGGTAGSGVYTLSMPPGVTARSGFTGVTGGAYLDSSDGTVAMGTVISPGSSAGRFGIVLEGGAFWNSGTADLGLDKNDLFVTLAGSLEIR